MAVVFAVFVAVGVLIGSCYNKLYDTVTIEAGTEVRIFQVYQGKNVQGRL